MNEDFTIDRDSQGGDVDLESEVGNGSLHNQTVINEEPVSSEEWLEKCRAAAAEETRRRNRQTQAQQQQQENDEWLLPLSDSREQEEEEVIEQSQNDR